MSTPFVAVPMGMFAFETAFFATNDEVFVVYDISTLV